MNGGASRDDGDGSGADDQYVAQGGDDGGQRVLLQRGQRLAQLSTEQLWLRFFAVGGDTGLVEIEAYLAGLMPLPSLQRDMLAHAVNERLDELLLSGQVPYSHTERTEPSQSPALTALGDLLAAAHVVAPDRLPALVADAGRTLGVDVTMYLVDHDQRLLVPATAGLAPSSLAHSRPALGIDSTLAGQAFRNVQTLASDTDEHQRLWMPLLDGTERLGVVEVQVPAPAHLDDPGLRAHCQHLVSLLGHLVTTVGARGDALDAVRRRRPRNPAAELVWQLLPPPTAASDAFTLSGWLEPNDTVGGDAFDYALSHSSVSLAVLDAMGHGLPAGLLAAAALAAYRNARRNGHGLLAQAHAIDHTISSLGAEGTFVTGFLGELDLTSGRLRYLSAGHPNPLLLRGGKVVRALTDGRRVPFGLGDLSDFASESDLEDADAFLALTGDSARVAESARVGEQALQPGDWLVVHTDGITEARDATGAFFGDARLADFLGRAFAAGQPPPETARRLAHAVLQHQGGDLQDDATVLLACWLRR